VPTVPTPAQQAGLEPGRATAYLVGLLDDATALPLVGGAVTDAVGAHRDHRAAEHGVLVGPLLIAVSKLGAVLDALDASPSIEPLDVVLVADTGLVAAAEARAVLLDDDRVELAGLAVVLPPDAPLGDAARLTLETLDFALPAAIAVPPAADWRDAFDVLAADGAERAGFRAAGTTAAPLVPDTELGAFVLAAVERSLPFTVTAGLRRAVRASDPVTGTQEHGFVNVLAATAAAIDGRAEHDVAALLAERDGVALLRVLAAADPSAVRRRFTSFASPSIDDAVVDLHALGMLDDD
jgi:hypothetical protein